MAHQKTSNDTTKILSYIVVALIAFSGGYLVRHLTGPTSGSAPTADAHQGAAAAPSGEQGDSAAGDTKIPIGNSPTLGPKDAPVTIVEYSDFECPFCQKGFKRMEKIRENFPKKVRLVFKHYPLPFHKNAKPAARAAMAAGEQGKFWEMHDRLFEKQGAWKKGNVKEITAGWAKEMGLDAAKFKKDFDKESYGKTIQAEMKEGQKLGVKGTPHFFINGEALSGAQPYNRFESVVKSKIKQADKLLKGGVAKADLYDKAVAKNYKAPSKPKPSKDKGKQKKQQKVEYVPVTDDDPSTGASTDEALVTIVAFSDFECPFCDKAVPTIEKIEENYGDQVRIVFKQLPLGFHQNAKPAAKASLAAHQQGKFWEMHDLLFENQKKLGQDGLYTKLAEQLGLNVSKFEKDMNSDAIATAVQKDSDLAKEVGARGTPNFWVNGIQVVGAQPYPKFKSVIDTQIKKAKQVKKEKGVSGDKLYKALAAINKEEAGSNGGGNAKPKPKKKDPKVDTGKLSVGDSPVKGPEDAPVTIYEFSDFECPYCGRAHPIVQQVLEEYEGKVKLIHKHYPLPFHKQAKPAAKAAIAAQNQGKFWEMYDIMFENQGQLGSGAYEKWASQIGLNVEKFKKDMKSISDERINDDMSMGKKVGVKGTPAFIINGKRLVGAQPFSKFKNIIDQEL